MTAANFSGAVADSQLSANIARLDGSNAFTGTITEPRTVTISKRRVLPGWHIAKSAAVELRSTPYNLSSSVKSVR